MPKLKTHSGAKKRFKVSSTGKVSGRAAHKRHRMTSKSKRMKREGKLTHILKNMDGMNILMYFLPFAKKKKRNTNTTVKKEAA